MKKYDNIMPYIHLPVQSGDETILKLMKRQMIIKDYLKLINYIRANIKDCAISTDLIVGFPNENGKQFANTIKLYRLIKFDNAYTFIYSKRKGTMAATLADKTSLVAKEKRLAELNELVRKYAKERCEYWNHKVVEVLVEGSSKTKKHILTGYSRQ
ncbi:hypothetical protein FACS1894218_5920 [Bacilli bacterium]|nr:hypothetical protein FACS1894218_5920 [Bacilli bacterium]